MTVIAMLSVAPIVEGGMSGEVIKAAAALDDFEVSYETNPMRTVIEADDIDGLLATIDTAHRAVDDDRVSTFLKIDDRRTGEQTAADKADTVEAHLGRETRSDRE